MGAGGRRLKEAFSGMRKDSDIKDKRKKRGEM
jgi:hypothetical protein